MSRPGEVSSSLNSTRDNQARFVRGQRQIVEFTMSGRMVEMIKSHGNKYGIDCSLSLHGMGSNPIPKVHFTAIIS